MQRTLLPGLILIVLLLLVFSSCSPEPEQKPSHQPDMPTLNENIYYQREGFTFPFDLSKASDTYELPRDLKEVSGLTWFDDCHLACVEDESGRIYIFDLESGEVTDKYDFEGPGDFEGLVKVGEEIWVARSDGRLFRYTPGGSTKYYDTPLDKDCNLEGLEWQRSKNRLLLACKGAAHDSITAGYADLKGKQVIYGFDLETKEMDLNPAYIIDPQELPEKSRTGKKKKKKFRPSGVAVHPETGDVYLIAHKGKLMMVLSEDGQQQWIQRMDSRLLPQPEGICFTPDGKLFLASEGDGGVGVILMFEN